MKSDTHPDLMTCLEESLKITQSDTKQQPEFINKSEF